jgi:hypothetical protein
LGSGADTVTANLDGTSLRISSNGGAILDSTSSPSVPASTLKALRIQTRGGNDIVNLSAMTTSDFPDLPEITVLTGAETIQSRVTMVPTIENRRLSSVRVRILSTEAVPQTPLMADPAAIRLVAWMAMTIFKAKAMKRSYYGKPWQ